MKPEPRRAVPMRVQRDLALKLAGDLMKKLGMIPVEISPAFELDHVPALALRAIGPNGQHVPHQHDPAHLVWMTKEAHAAKTFGTGATTRGADAGDIAHLRRLNAKELAFQARLMARDTGEELPITKRKVTIPARPKKDRRQQNSATRPLSKPPVTRRDLQS